MPPSPSLLGTSRLHVGTWLLPSVPRPEPVTNRLIIVTKCNAGQVNFLPITGTNTQCPHSLPLLHYLAVPSLQTVKTYLLNNNKTRTNLWYLWEKMQTMLRTIFASRQF